MTNYIYMGMTQAELDAQYDQRSAVPHANEYISAWRRASDRLRSRSSFTTHRYGPGPNEVLDLFIDGAPSAAHLHLHGGAWRALSKEDASFVAAGLVPQRTAVAIADFSLAPAARLADIVAETRRCFMWLRDWARARGLPISVSGHSSGAHLAACLLHRGWWDAEGLDTGDFAGVLLASGVYDLAPVRLSSRNHYLDLSEHDATALSPIAQLPDRLPPLAIYFGELELAEFRRQSRDFAVAAVRSASASAVVSAELPGLNHFDIYDAFGDPTSVVCRFLRT